MSQYSTLCKILTQITPPRVVYVGSIRKRYQTANCKCFVYTPRGHFVSCYQCYRMHSDVIAIIFFLPPGFETTTDQIQAAEISKEKILIKHLLDKYHFYGRVGRPVTNTSDRITVEFGLSLIQIMNVDEKNQVLETNVWYTYVSCILLGLKYL